MTLFELVAKDTECQSLLGVNPIRFAPFGDEHSKCPYAVYQTIGGFPENPLTGQAKADRVNYQIDAYAKTYKEAQAVGEAIRKAIELHSYVTAIRGISLETETKLYRMSFDCDLYIYR